MCIDGRSCGCHDVIESHVHIECQLSGPMTYLLSVGGEAGLLSNRILCCLPWFSMYGLLTLEKKNP